MHNAGEAHRQLILDQFTKQAVPFAEMPAHSHDEANQLLIDMAQIGSDDTVLDERIRRIFAEDIGVDRLGVGAHRQGGAIHFAFPIVVLVGET